VFRKDFYVKGAKRRLRRSKALDRKILSKLLLAIAIDGVMRSAGHRDCDQLADAALANGEQLQT